MRRLLVAVAVLLVLGVAGAVGAWRWVESSGHKSIIDEDVVFEVQKGVVGSRLPKLLGEAGILKGGTAVRAAQGYVKLHPVLPKYGKHQLKKGMSLAEVLENLADNPMPDDFPVRDIIEGNRLVDTDAALVIQKLIEPGEYVKAAKEPSRFKDKIPFKFTAKDLEGYLYPETYMMPVGRFDLNLLIQRQIEKFNETFAKPYAEEIEKSGHPLHELVIIASMLEREELNPENRPKIAGIIYKRIEKKIALGIDATSRYQLASWKDEKQFIVKLRDEADPYNSRRNLGLPPTPIGAPTLSSLLAALRPEKSDALYYLHDASGKCHFAKDNAEHEANRAKYNVH